ncbi:MAG: lipopolysaccharide biosynthesis protein [Hyphomonas sp.]|uniref:lipopolysaccharide biosynthesis protein n=1 Tax=Hyphomonas sp. TaxID=87 RepID=UPI0017E8C112|nr:lipopolysaccharide biosynthesis protein [Hyphomonas sp.]MBU3920950.1 lipopolysaccharide biosynthesis protein [Alphaproteobacteria bacterium]MBA3068625.1 lipopolysaccharide biosynthesis protein [Hyphomonas sp.]MBU4061944.1 lipopolysaccharide biosynthesis protein [Alphaproteobacteria bacterium]MBU4166099.1 lipopolysaccharide biosynthesis protein [Alphaproteobacteria bacterium]MBU4568679.1 lipopolysaccharide biosynthesis protein [Alphaproteobacteria bacterium]
MSLARHLAGYLPVNLASGIASFGAVYVFTRVMGAAEYGTYALMLWAMSVIHTISITWVEAATYRFTAEAESRGDLAGHYRTAITLMLRALALALALAALLWFALRGQPAYAATLPWIAALLPLNTVVQVSLQAHKAGLRVGRYAFTETFRLLTGFALGALIAWQLKLGAASPFIGMTVAAGLMALREGRWLIGAARGGTTDAARQIAWTGYGLPIAAALVLDLVVSGIDRPMIAALLPDGEAAVGAYAAGYGVADKTVLLLCTWAAMAGAPLMMAAYERGGKEAAALEARGLIRTLLLIGVPAAAGIALVARPLGEAMIGEAVRAQAITIIPWIAASGLLNGLLILYFAEAFTLARRSHERAILMLVPAGVNIAANFLLIPLMGLMGAVVATVICYVTGLLLLAFAGRRHVALPLPLMDVARIGLAALAMWPVIAVMPDLGGWPELILKAGAGAITYGAAALVLDAGGARTFMRNRRG